MQELVECFELKVTTLAAPAESKIMKQCIVRLKRVGSLNFSLSNSIELERKMAEVGVFFYLLKEHE